MHNKLRVTSRVGHAQLHTQEPANWLSLTTNMDVSSLMSWWAGLKPQWLDYGSKQVIIDHRDALIRYLKGANVKCPDTKRQILAF